MTDDEPVIEVALRYSFMRHYSEDVMNAAKNCAEPRFSPITALLARALDQFWQMFGIDPDVPAETVGLVNRTIDATDLPEMA